MHSVLDRMGGRSRPPSGRDPGQRPGPDPRASGQPRLPSRRELHARAPSWSRDISAYRVSLPPASPKPGVLPACPAVSRRADLLRTRTVGFLGFSRPARRESGYVGRERGPQVRPATGGQFRVTSGVRLQASHGAMAWRRARQAASASSHLGGGGALGEGPDFLGDGAPVGGGGQLAEYREQAEVDALAGGGRPRRCSARIARLCKMARRRDRPDAELRSRRRPSMVRRRSDTVPVAGEPQIPRMMHAVLASGRVPQRQALGTPAGCRIRCRRAADMVPPSRTTKTGGVTWHRLRRQGRETRYGHVV